LSQHPESLSPLARKDGGPLFDEAWQAEVLAIADSLVQSGYVGRQNWAEALGNKLAAAEQFGKPDNAETYYQCMLKAVECLLDQANTITPDEMSARRDAWKTAYLRTPHGQPVLLSAAQHEA
jgi:Nitrile hydratase beta subunit, N-terminal